MCVCVCVCVDLPSETGEGEKAQLISAAPFTLLFACGDPAPIFCIILCVKVSEAARGDIPLRR